MKRAALLLSVLALVVMSAQPAGGQDDPADQNDKPGKKKGKGARKKGKSKGESLRGEYAIMAKELNLTPDQEAKLKEKDKAKRQALAKWHKANDEKVKELTAAMKQARKDKDAAKTKEIAQQLKELQAEREKIQADTQASIMEMLTKDQQATWAGFHAYRGVMARLRKVKLTDDQKASARELCTASGVELAECGSDRKGKKAKAAICKKLVEEVVRDVLTDEQREQLKKTGGAPKGDKKGKKGKKDKGEAPAEDPAL